MPCYHPNYACFVDGKAQPKILGHYVREDLPGKVFVDGRLRDLLKLPCGQCIGCRLEYSRQWADRCVMESLTTPDDMSWFVTLTYDDDHLPPLLSDISDSPYPGSIDWDDHQLFFKRLREHAARKGYGDNLRHYSASEYGTKELRPHYHSMIYNLKLPDLTYYKRNKLGDVLYNSDFLTDLWGKGFVVVGQASWRTAAYTARYVVKKRKGKDAADFYDAFDIKPESTRSSNRPGIATDYYNQHWQDLYYGASQKIVLPPVGGVPYLTTPPRFFDEKFKKIDPERLEQIKLKRRDIAEEVEKSRARMLCIVGSEDEYFCELEKNLLRKPQYRIDI